jgi:RNA polymerase sporulation-specific sigma factor
VKFLSYSQQNSCLLERVANGDTSAKSELIEENLGLVHAMARRFMGRGIEYDDLFQAGCMGLVKATKGFDISRGVQFSTYAVPVIMGEMRRLFRDDGPIKISRTLKELSLKVSREKENLGKALCREPTISEIAAVLKIEPAEAAEALEASYAPMSLTLEGEGDDIQADIPVECVEEALVDKLALKEALKHLSNQDRMLIILRYFNNKTQNEAAKELSMTQVQVSRREKRILEQLRFKLSG